MNDINTIMRISPSELYETQHRVFKNHVIGILQVILDHIEKENYDEVLGYLDESPAGDGMGEDNSFINFHYDESAQYAMDINDACKKLKQLKRGGEE